MQFAQIYRKVGWSTCSRSKLPFHFPNRDTHTLRGASVWECKGLKRFPAVLSASMSRPITLAGVQQYGAINYSLAALPSIQGAGESSATAT